MRQAIVKTEPMTCFQLIEVQVPAQALSKAPFPDVPELRSDDSKKVVIRSIEVYSPKILTKGPTCGQATSPLSELVKVSLVLISQGWNKLANIPMLRLNPMLDTDSTAATTVPFAPGPVNFEALGAVDWSKCYVQYNNSQTSSGSAYCFIFGVSYVLLDAQGNPTKP